MGIAEQLYGLAFMAVMLLILAGIITLLRHITDTDPRPCRHCNRGYEGDGHEHS